MPATSTNDKYWITMFDPVTAQPAEWQECINRGIADYSDKLVSAMFAAGKCRDPREDM